MKMFMMLLLFVSSAANGADCSAKFLKSQRALLGLLRGGLASKALTTEDLRLWQNGVIDGTGLVARVSGASRQMALRKALRASIPDSALGLPLEDLISEGTKLETDVRVARDSTREIITPQILLTEELGRMNNVLDLQWIDAGEQGLFVGVTTGSRVYYLIGPVGGESKKYAWNVAHEPVQTEAAQTHFTVVNGEPTLIVAVKGKVYLLDRQHEAPQVIYPPPPAPPIDLARPWWKRLFAKAPPPPPAPAVASVTQITVTGPYITMILDRSQMTIQDLRGGAPRDIATTNSLQELWSAQDAQGGLSVAVLGSHKVELYRPLESSNPAQTFLLAERESGSRMEARLDKQGRFWAAIWARSERAAGTYNLSLITPSVRDPLVILKDLSLNDGAAEHLHLDREGQMRFQAAVYRDPLATPEPATSDFDIQREEQKGCKLMLIDFDQSLRPQVRMREFAETIHATRWQIGVAPAQILVGFGSEIRTFYPGAPALPEQNFAMDRPARSPNLFTWNPWQKISLVTTPWETFWIEADQPHEKHILGGEMMGDLTDWRQLPDGRWAVAMSLRLNSNGNNSIMILTLPRN